METAGKEVKMRTEVDGFFICETGVKGANTR